VVEWCNASVLVNDRASTGDRLLQSGDRLQLAPGATLQFDDGAPRPPARRRHGLAARRAAATRRGPRFPLRAADAAC
jgi:hypothetical protein